MLKTAIYGLAGAVMVSAAWAGDTVDVRSLAPGASSPAASIDELGWLVGRWKGTGLGGGSEEFIAPPLGGQMMGMFRQSKADGALAFYEFYLFAETDGSLILKIKHFNPDLTGWEEKDEFEAFPLVAVEDKAVYFDGVTFKMTDTDEMRAAVLVDSQGVAEFIYERAD